MQERSRFFFIYFFSRQAELTGLSSPEIPNKSKSGRSYTDAAVFLVGVFRSVDVRQFICTRDRLWTVSAGPRCLQMEEGSVRCGTALTLVPSGVIWGKGYECGSLNCVLHIRNVGQLKHTRNNTHIFDTSSPLLWCFDEQLTDPRL